MVRANCLPPALSPPEVMSEGNQRYKTTTDLMEDIYTKYKNMTRNISKQEINQLKASGMFLDYSSSFDQ